MKKSHYFDTLLLITTTYYLLPLANLLLPRPRNRWLNPEVGPELKLTSLAKSVEWTCGICKLHVILSNDLTSFKAGVLLRCGSTQHFKMLVIWIFIAEAMNKRNASTAVRLLSHHSSGTYTIEVFKHW